MAQPLPPHLYVHVPFCARRCSYCDFSIAVRRDVPVEEYVRALLAEFDLRFSHREPTPWPLETLYLGGGTPSRLGAPGIESLVQGLRDRLTISPDAEVTIEANPDDVTPEAARAWRAVGINRMSLGAQSFDSGALTWMHRTHTSQQIGAAVDAARSAGIENLSLDLIFALPPSLGRDWGDDLARAVALAPSHISLYGLTVHERTPLARWRDRGELTEAPDDTYATEFLLAHEVITAAGFEHYEVSSYALPGFRSRHNASYWSGVPWMGLGPAAHEFDGQRRRWNVGPYASWVRAISEGRDPREGEEVLTSANREAERVYLGLRTSSGLGVDGLNAQTIASWIRAGWAVETGGVLRLTPEGWLRLDSLAAALT
jgi:oxygen-independent coproporphyrinogen-3 oxidase